MNLPAVVKLVRSLIVLALVIQSAFVLPLFSSTTSAAPVAQAADQAPAQVYAPKPTATPFASPLPTPTPVPTTPPTNSSMVVGPEGGHLAALNNHLQLDVPPGLFQRQTRIKIRPQLAGALTSAMSAPQMSPSARVAFELTAEDLVSDTLITEFAQPLMLTVDLNGLVDRAQLQPFEHLAIFYQTDNPDVPWSELVDAREVEPGVMQVPLQHFSTYAAGSSGDAPAGWKLKYNPPVVSTFSGAATFSYPIEVGPGRNGLQPSIVLGYNSRSVDGVVNINTEDSDGVPFGWSLDMASISRDGTEVEGSPTVLLLHARYSLAINGANYELTPATANALSGRYYAKDAPGLLVERHNKYSDPGTYSTTLNLSKEYWLVKTGEGATYRFGYNIDSEQTQKIDPAHYLRCEDNGYCGEVSGTNTNNPAWGTAPVRWRVDRISDVFGNVITVTYQTKATQQDLNSSELTAEHTRPAEIKYNFSNGVAASRIVFSNSVDNTYNWINRIAVYHAGETNKVREYQLGWDGALLRMTALTQTNASGTAWLPPTTFQHQEFAHGNGTEAPMIPYLTQINNGYGGRTVLNYGSDGRHESINHNLLYGYSYRLTETLTYDGLNPAPAKVRYDYGTPCYDEKNTYVPGVVFCQGAYPPDFGPLVGHQTVTQTTYADDGNTVLARTVYTYSIANNNSPLRGRELSQQASDTSSRPLVQSASSYTNLNVGLTTFTYLAQADTTTFDGTHSVTQRITNTYDTYGNPVAKFEYGALNLSGDERRTYWGYAPNTSATVWIVNKPISEAVYSGLSGSALAQTRYVYDNLPAYTSLPTKGALTRVERWDGVKWITATQTGYDAWGNPVVITDALTHTMTTAYDPQYHLYPITVTNALSQAAVTQYDFALGVLTSVTDPNGAVTSYTYDAFGRLLSVIRPGDSVVSPTVSYQYTDVYTTTGLSGLRVQQQVREGSGDSNVYRSAYSFYDGLGRLVQTRAAAENNQQRVTNIAYEARGLKQFEDVPIFETATLDFVSPPANRPHTETQYDALGRAVKVIQPDGIAITTTYAIISNTQDADFNNGGRVGTSITDANNHVRRNSYDGLGNLLTVTENPGVGESRTRYGYDALGNLRVVTDALTNRTFIDYNALGQKTVMTDTDMGTWQYAYDLAGNLTRQTDARGQRLCFYYDSLNRVTGKQYRSDNNCPTSNPTLNVTYTYDSGFNGLGRRTATDDASGRTEWTYDERGRVFDEYRTIGNLGAFRIAYDYDAQDRVTAITYPNGEVVAQTYNAAGQLSSVSGINAYVTNIAYNALGQLTSLPLGNNLTTQYAYDPLNARLKQIQVGSYLNLNYAYDPVGNIKVITDVTNSTQTQTFQYDAVDRLVSAATNAAGEGRYSDTYQYNAIGNITYTNRLGNYGYNDSTHKHAVTHLGGVQKFWYDANGNMITRTETISGAAVTYAQSWDAENRLSVVTNTLTNEVTKFVYDGDGARVAQIYSGTYTSTTAYFGSVLEITALGAPPVITPTTSPPTMTYRSYLPLFLAQKVGRMAPLGNETWKMYYAAGNQVVALREFTTSLSSTLYYLSSDHLGSTSAIFNDSGVRVGELRYRPYGEIRYTSGVSPTARQFTGQYNDATGLMYFRARYYSTAVGRFVSADTIVPDPSNPQAWNSYAYVYNSPLNLIDPSGHKPICDLDDPCIDPVVWDQDALDNTTFDDRRDAEAAYYDFLADPAKYLSYMMDPATIAKHPEYNALSVYAEGVENMPVEDFILGNFPGLSPEVTELTPAELAYAAQLEQWPDAVGAAAVPIGGVYLLRSGKTVMYVGRTKNLAQRRLQHLRKSPGLDFDPIVKSNSYDVQRGTEELLYREYHPPNNKIRPIRLNNPKINQYLRAGRRFLFGAGERRND